MLVTFALNFYIPVVKNISIFTTIINNLRLLLSLLAEAKRNVYLSNGILEMSLQIILKGNIII